MYYLYEWIHTGNYLDWLLHECYSVENKNYGLRIKINDHLYKSNQLKKIHNVKSNFFNLKEWRENITRKLDYEDDIKAGTRQWIK